MFLDFLTNYSWIIWLALILIFGIIELTTLELTFLMIAGGSLGGLLVGLLGVPWWAQILVAAVLSVLLLFAVRPRLLLALSRGEDPTPTNVDALLGQPGLVVNGFAGNPNQVKLSNGETWTVALSPGWGERSLVEGERVIVTAIEGATAIVVPAERTA
jgi:membrane protein implicated in regulation of membrane protease activity